MNPSSEERSLAQEEINNACLNIYRETREFEPFRLLREQTGATFEVLMGPPFRNPHCLFIGYQPGNWELSPEQARAAGYENSWVTDECHYANANWYLAQQIRKIYGEKNLPLLHRSVGLNAIFLRASNEKEYLEHPEGLRNQIETFSLAKVSNIVDLLEPNRIVVIGFNTMKLLGNSNPDVLRLNGTPMTRIGEVFNRPALATFHLSSVRFLRTDERNHLYERVREFLELF
jgi:hypothetical protein